MPERIPEEKWRNETGHVWRYSWAANQIQRGETVLDIACGIGYGAEVLAPTGCFYLGVDKPGAISETFWGYGEFIETDIDTWTPDADFDVIVCFETLEHVGDLDHLVGILNGARRLICVSVPTIPTVGINPFHVRDFAEDDVPALFDDFDLTVKKWQPSEQSHVYMLTRR
jgi:SAM-dependent methyltransferase